MNGASRGAEGKTARFGGTVAGALALGAFVAGAAMGCGSEKDEQVPTPPSDEPSEAVGPLVPGVPIAPELDPNGGSSSGTGTSDGASQANFGGGAAPAEPVLTPDQSCAAQAVQAETIERVVEVPVEEEVVVPSVFYVMLDSSGSMVNDPFTLAGLVEDILDFFGLGQSPPAPTKWDYAIEGLTSFVNDPASDGLELGLGYFPDVGLCDGSGYDVPAVVLGTLPGNAPALQFSLESRVPDGGTPLEGALRGATSFCAAFNAERPDASCVAVLITDGAAEECDARTAESLASIAQNATAAGVLTFAAGMQGADFGVLDAIGQAGGGDCDPAAPGFACDLTADRDAFVRALNGIRDRTRTQTRIERRIVQEVQTLPCEWEIPAPPEGQSFDSGRVNVQLTVPGAAALPVAHVQLEADCGADGGWFYDDPEAPTVVQACPSTCDLMRAEPDTRVSLLFGCTTVLR